MTNPSRNAILSALLLVWAGAAIAQPKARLTESIKDLGVVQLGDKPRHTFVIQNRGDEALLVTEVKATCGCTVVDYDERVPAGGEGKVAVALSTRNLRGPVAKSVRVYTNDPGNPRVDLVLKANVLRFVDASPGYARFLTVQGEAAEASEQIVWAETGANFGVLEAVSPYPFIKTDFRKAEEGEGKSGKSGRQWIVSISIDPNAPQGAFADFVTLKLRHPRRKALRIPVSGFVRSVVAVKPRVADFGERDPQASSQTVLELQNLGKSPVSLGEIYVDVAGISSELEVVEEGKLFKLRLALDPAMPKGDFNGTLTIATSSPLQPEIRVDLRGTVL